jgi:hypothetical protein
MERYYEVSDETQNFFNWVVSELAFPMKINFKLIGDSKLKKLIKVNKVSPIYKFITDQDIIVYLNEDILDAIGEKADLKLLFTEELNNISINLEKGSIKIEKFNLSTSTSVIDKFGLDEVKRVKDLERLTFEQQSDMKEDEKQMVDFLS